MSRLKKLFLSFLASLILLTSFFPVLASNVYAQTSASSTTNTWYNQNFKDWFSRVYDSPPSDVFGERYTAAQVQWIIYGFTAFVLNAETGSPKMTSCILNNKSLAQCKVEEFINSVLDQIKSKIPGASSTNNSILGFIFTEDRSMSGITYFRNVGRNWHIIPEAKAQGAGASATGFGFSALDPILPVWRAARNIAYGVLVLAVVILAFMIMFRVKINPQTAITVQSAIPKVVVALILITFSYAIAGFMVDLMYVVIGFISLILSQAYSSVGSNLPFVTTSPGDLFGYMTVGPSLKIGPAGGGSGIFGALMGYVPLFGITAVVALLGTGGVVGAFSTAAVTSAAAGALATTGIGLIIMVILLLVLLVALLIFLLKTVWTLLKAFATVILLVIFAPLQIALGVVVPQISFGSWLRSFIANLAVFPLVGTLISLAFYFLYLSATMSLQALVGGGVGQFLFGRTFASPSGWPPLLNVGTSSGSGLVFLGVSMMMMALIPKAADVIQGLISGRPFAYGTAIGEALGLPVTAVRVGGAGGVSAGAKALAARKGIAGTRLEDIIEQAGTTLAKRVGG